MKNVFAGRTIGVVNDLSRDEQLYLYRKTAELKKKYLNNEDVSEFRIVDPDMSAYLIFMENSTRTKESFRNACQFHDIKLNIFDAGTSSFAKQESYSDTIKMLFGYSKRSLFIMRTGEEGVCHFLDEELGEYARKMNYDKAAFINGGDGKHEHPTQEFLDEFTFLEKKNWDNSEIHIVLTGDLYHGRTVHSKVDGLRVFDKVRVDLVAPAELSMPDYYENRMIENGFEVRKFDTIEEYLEQDDVADIWYFTRLQLERMGDKVKEKEHQLRTAVTFRREFMDRIPPQSKFYHPLPRHKVYPVIPGFLDHTSYNGWDEQSVNGFFTRTIEISMCGGKIGGDFDGEGLVPKKKGGHFIENVPVTRKSRVEDRYKVGIKPVDEGIVIDHIGSGHDVEAIWNRIDKIRRILKFNCRSSHGVFHSNDRSIYKGIISLPDIMELSETEIKKISAIAPGCTLNIIRDASVHEKFRLHMPPKIYNFEEISCKNENCISHPEKHQHVKTRFNRSSDSKFVCKYCEKSHSFEDIWDI